MLRNLQVIPRPFRRISTALLVGVGGSPQWHPLAILANFRFNKNALPHYPAPPHFFHRKAAGSAAVGRRGEFARCGIHWGLPRRIAPLTTPHMRLSPRMFRQSSSTESDPVASRPRRVPPVSYAGRVDRRGRHAQRKRPEIEHGERRPTRVDLLLGRTTYASLFLAEFRTSPHVDVYSRHIP